MGKPSKFSKRNLKRRGRKRKRMLLRELKWRKEEVGDLQVQLTDFKKQVWLLKSKAKRLAIYKFN